MDEAQAIPAAEDAALAEPVSPRKGGILRGIWRFTKAKPLGAFGFLLIIFLFAMTLGTPKAEFGTPALPDRPFGFELGSPWMQRHPPEKIYAQHEAPTLISVSIIPPRITVPEHFFGTDNNGRDTWSRIVNGCTLSSEREIFFMEGMYSSP